MSILLPGFSDGLDWFQETPEAITALSLPQALIASIRSGLVLIRGITLAKQREYSSSETKESPCITAFMATSLTADSKSAPENPSEDLTISVKQADEGSERRFLLM